MLVLFLATAINAQPINRNYQVKAAFLYNFTRFVEWPLNSFADENAPFIIGILGDDPFGSFIDELVAGEKIGSHPIRVYRYATVKDIRNCHILYINQTNTREVLNSLNNRGILTVSDYDFTRQGGMIRFFTRENKIRLEINPVAARAARLTISSKLLRVAEITKND